MAVPRIVPKGPRIKGIPVFTPQQFAQARPKAPKGGYERYLQYIRARRGARSGAPAPGKQPPLPTYQSLLRGLPRMETPAQLEARARRMADYDITSEKSLLESEYKRSSEEARLRMQAMAEAGRAAAQLNAGLFGQVGGEYNAAAREISGLATGLAGGVGAQTAADVANANAALAAVGAPGVEATGALAGPGQADVEAYRGGTLPAQNLGTQGQAATFGLAGMIGAQNLRATQEATAGLRDTSRELERSRMDAVRELARGRPGQVAKYLADLQDAQRQQIALASSLIGAGYEQGMTTKKFKQDVKQQGIQNKQWWSEYTSKNQQWQQTFNENVRQFNAQMNAKATAEGVDLNTVDPSASRVWGFLVNKAGQPIIGRNGKPIPVAKGSSASKAARYTPGQLASLMGKAQQQAETFYYGYATDAKGKRVPATELGTFDPDNPETYGKSRLPWGQALQRLTSMGVPAQAARGVLSQHYLRGDMGRPIFLPEEWAMLKQRIGRQRLNWLTRAINDMFDRGQDDEAEEMINQALGTQGGNVMWVGKPTR